MKRSVLVFLALLSAIVLSVTRSSAESTTPAGRWKTVDDATGRAKSIVSIWEQDGMRYGRIEALLDQPADDPDPKCVHCTGDLKNQRVIGMQILWDLEKNGDQWSGGKVLDPNNGKAYRCSIAVEEGGRKLKVRGFIGFSLIGRTQYWLREQ